MSKKNKRIIAVSIRINNPEKCNPGMIAAIKKANGQKALAALLGISQPSISKFLRTRPSTYTAVRINSLLGIPLADLRPDLYE